LFSPNHSQDGPWGGCRLEGISLSGNKNLGNLGSIIIAFFAILIAGFLLWRSERKKAAVGRRLVLGYLMFVIFDNGEWADW
jgi:hypothetical protein